jgi:hypothetical protein
MSGKQTQAVNQTQYIRKNRKILLSLIAFNVIVWVLFAFGIILPIIGGIWVQLVWTGLFMWYLFKFYKQRRIIKTKIILVLLTLFVSLPFMLINLSGAVYWYYPEYKGKCHEQYIYSRISIPNISPKPIKYYLNSYVPFLYLKKVQPNDRFYVFLNHPYSSKAEGSLGDVLVCVENRGGRVISSSKALE